MTETRPEAPAAVSCKNCGRPIVRCDSLSSHIGCSSGHGWVHSYTGGHDCRSGPFGCRALPDPSGPWPAATGALTPILPAIRDALSSAISEAQYAATERPYREALDRLDQLEAEVTGKLSRLRSVLLEGGQDAATALRRALGILCDDRGNP